MTRGIIVMDIDGVLTRDQFSRFGGIGPAGRVIWWGLRGIGVADRLMRDAVPDVLAREWIRHLRRLGYLVHLRTGRVESQRDITQEWLDKNCFEHDGLFMRLRGQELCQFKLAGVRRSAGCVIYIDDSHELCREAAKLGDDAPIVIESTDWRIVATVLRALTKET
jgi:hypothetical protein